ncbi:MAG TPA: hydantoinase B/oxoprolinase family protein [Solirubrobacteraceae bacterium]|jgi:acetophenone carboxylase|nr:hydantoinase B/oxoprolinase family protein [Solirubrobacteraceae bacterium]
MTNTVAQAEPAFYAPEDVPEHLRVTPLEVTPANVVQWIKPEPTSEREAHAMELLAPGDYEIYREKLVNFLAETREIFTRSGVTSMLRSGDCIVAIYTANGDLVNASAGTYLHCVTATLPVKYVLHKFLTDPTVGVREGDIWYANEAAYGGIHNPDQVAFEPIFHDGELIAWSAALAHQPETGAIEPGGMPLSARTRNDEGMKITPMRIGENYRIRSDVLEMMVNQMGRAPRMQAVDTRARATGADRLRIRLQELADERGNEFMRGLLRRHVVEAETAARRRISRWNDGTFRATVFIDTIGREPALVRGQLAATKRGDEILMDYTGTSPENDSSYNCFPHIVAAHTAVYIYAYAFQDLPISNGSLAAFTWTMPPGSVFNATPDAAISNSPTLCSLAMSLAPLVFSRMMFDSVDHDQVAAPISNAGSAIIFAGPNQHGVPVAELETSTLNTEGHGARFDKDGVDAYGFPWGHAGRAMDVEDGETEYQFLRLYFNLRTDSGGFGTHQGGLGTETALCPRHVPIMFFQTLGKNSLIPVSAGLFGGYPSASMPGIWISGTNLWEKLQQGAQDLPHTTLQLATERSIAGRYAFEHANRVTRIAQNGDVIVQLAGGGGGYGDVLRRDPAAVAADLRGGRISRWTAENLYAVRFLCESTDPDLPATEQARNHVRTERLAQGAPYQEFLAEWSQLRPADEAIAHFGTWPDGVLERPIVRI